MHRAALTEMFRESSLRIYFQSNSLPPKRSKDLMARVHPATKS